MWAMIATWRMSLEGVSEAKECLAKGKTSKDAVESAITAVENFPYYKSVGYGGLPNEQQEVELDAAFMDGDTLSIGAVGAIQDFANPIKIARRLSQEQVNNFLVGSGAEQFAHKEGFERKNMLSERAKIHYHNRQVEMKEREIKPYDGHDTVGMLALDQRNSIVAGTSTSGLFMKKKGRLGDSAVIGAGLYADSQIGAATATGLGEDLMKGVISYEIVRLMSQGQTPQQACEQAVEDLARKLQQKQGRVGDLSVVALNAKGEWGAATTIDNFSIVVASEQLSPTVYLVDALHEGHCRIHEAPTEWLEHYMNSRMAPLEKKELHDDTN